MQTNEVEIKLIQTTSEEEFIMKPYIDWCFKELMRNPKTRTGFIAALLRLPPEQIGRTTILENELSKRTEEEKQGVLDVRVLLESGTQLDIEMQVLYIEYWDDRSLFYLSKMYAEQVKEGDKYKNLKPCIQVSILNFNLFHEDRTCFREIAFCDLTTKQKYTDLLEIYVLELKKLPPEQKEEPLIIKWMRFLAAESREDFEKMAGEDNYINEAYEVLQKLSADERKRLEYEARQKAIRDYDSQMSSSREEGIRIGEDRLNHLYEKLMRDHRSDDLVKAISDKVYREKLYQEYGL